MCPELGLIQTGPERKGGRVDFLPTEGVFAVLLC